MSFDNRLGNFNSFIEILSNVSAYAPNETDLTTTALKVTSIALKAKNDAVSSTFVPLSHARGVRDNTLYLGANSVVNTALLVKVYVSGAMGTSSQLNKQIKGLQFKRRN